MSGESFACPCCKRQSNNPQVGDYGERITIRCRCCGTYVVTRSAAVVIERAELKLGERAALMHRVRSASRSRNFELDSTLFESWRTSLEPQTPFEQIENFLLWLAAKAQPGQRKDVKFDDHQAIIGVVDKNGFEWVLDQSQGHGWIDGNLARPVNDTPPTMLGARLTLLGWQKVDELRRTGKDSKHAFIAMKFGDAELDSLLSAHLIPAVRATGFELRALNDGQPAGLIDDQLRVAIRRARFVLVDLSHGNKGAYWEAGFAEGLGKPVIYLCREDVFNDSKHPHKPHFDTNHLVTIIWNSAKMEEAAARLRACIRATLPDEAILED
jgi:hypothetical protein